MVKTLDHPRVIQSLQDLNLIKDRLFFPLDEFLGDDLERDGAGRVSGRRSAVPCRSDYLSKRARTQGLRDDRSQTGMQGGLDEM